MFALSQEARDRIDKSSKMPLTIMSDRRLGYRYDPPDTWKWKWQQILPEDVKTAICFVWNRTYCFFFGHFLMDQMGVCSCCSAEHPEKDRIEKEFWAYVAKMRDEQGKSDLSELVRNPQSVQNRLAEGAKASFWSPEGRPLTDRRKDPVWNEVGSHAVFF